MLKPLQLAPSDAEEQQQYFQRNSRAPHHISQAEPCHPVMETHSGCMHLWTCSFCHDTNPMTLGEGCNVDRPVKWETGLPAELPLHHNGPVERLHHWCFISRSILPLLVNKTLRYLTSSSWGRTQSEKSTLQTQSIIIIRRRDYFCISLWCRVGCKWHTDRSSSGLTSWHGNDDNESLVFGSRCAHCRHIWFVSKRTRQQFTHQSPASLLHTV